MSKQLTLSLGLRSDDGFHNFIVGDNQILVESLMSLSRFSGEDFIFFWGEASSGCTHLLQACCKQATENTLTSVYIPLSDWKTLSPVMLEDIAHIDVVCIDDLDAIAGQSVWEEAVFHCYNALAAQHKKLVIAAHCPVMQSSIRLKDLKSRLQAGLGFSLALLPDEERIKALQLRALERGLTLPGNVATYLLNHAPRDLGSLFRLLDQLDQASLEAKHKLTLPFVKKVMAG